MNAKLEKFDKENYLHVTDAKEIAKWTKSETGLMLPIPPQDICEHPYGVLATGFIGPTIKVAGYIAIKEVSSDGKIGQIGTFVVNPECRGQGLGKRMLHFILNYHQKTLPDIEQLYSYVNHESLPIYLTAGGIISALREPPYETSCIYEVDMSPALKNVDTNNYGSPGGPPIHKGVNL